MKPLYTQEEFKLAKSTDELPLECYQCSIIFNRKQKYLHDIKNNKFCSKNCRNKSKITSQQVICVNCNLIFEKTKSQIEKSNNHFCSKSCAATFNNKNKTTGYRRSKIEIWFEEQLTQLYPNLPIDFNQKTAIGSELDIYIPSLNLAIELNGIFHYEPIFGLNKLDQIKNNDISKSLACFDAKIDLCIIDISQQKYFKPSTSQKYLDIIINIINERTLSRFELSSHK